MDKGQGDEDYDAKTGHYDLWGGYWFSESNRVCKIDGCQFEQNEASDEDAEDLGPGLDHAALVGISNLLDDKRVESNVLKDHAHHHEGAEKGEEGSIGHVGVKRTNEESDSGQQLADEYPGFTFTVRD